MQHMLQEAHPQLAEQGHMQGVLQRHVAGLDGVCGAWGGRGVCGVGTAMCSSPPHFWQCARARGGGGGGGVPPRPLGGAYARAGPLGVGVITGAGLCVLVPVVVSRKRARWTAFSPRSASDGRWAMGRQPVPLAPSCCALCSVLLCAPPSSKNKTKNTGGHQAVASSAFDAGVREARNPAEAQVLVS
jgi:hypothetical protein